MERERFGSRLGFILVSAGCAIGLGNVWRFPYITGEYGGAAFVVLYLIFLVIFALPVLVMEFAAGRASQRSIARSYDELEPEGRKWHRFKWVGLAGNYLLMMFYTVVAGWMLAFMVKSAMGEFNGASTEHVASVFGQLLADPVQMTIYMLIIVAIGVITTRAGLKNGVERVTKVMMVALFVVLVALCVRAVTLPGAEEGLEFYLMPDFGKLFAGNTPAEQWATFGDAVYAALGQAFFTVSVGMGSMAIFGSYIGKDRRLTGEAVRVGVLDTLVALMAGLVIFPSCFAFGVEPASGPSLVFITLPIVFNAMPLGQLWGTLFFLFMSFAALSTVIAVFETIMAFSMDQWGVRREKACLVNGALIALLSIPCVLGFNVLSGVAIPGIGDIQSIEDFLVSNNILPLGGLFLVMFVTSKRGWGWKNFLAEADTGEGLRFPAWSYRYMKYVLPVGIVIIFVLGYAPIVSTWLGVS
ncbi:sodium-dependent transporter [Ellagibacter isourolithinifaciens]|uniref:sodium-dependent transporter n=2 Tax=Ellagibacter isourolithinifaciens TaxID=2137581 RepID=UPI000D7AD951|nr:sodium-dependent transporter [Ellagibacter isourolithinifaciens]MEE0246206.1 sodium-dependent transporter [Ellagibacter isourolithinifaciens]PWM43738.1 MAG: sodium-dependent transporter [Coriobacteriia bacterium]